MDNDVWEKVKEHEVKISLLTQEVFGINNKINNLSNIVENYFPSMAQIIEDIKKLREDQRINSATINSLQNHTRLICDTIQTTNNTVSSIYKDITEFISKHQLDPELIKSDLKKEIEELLFQRIESDDIRNKVDNYLRDKLNGFIIKLIIYLFGSGGALAIIYKIIEKSI